MCVGEVPRRTIIQAFRIFWPSHWSPQAVAARAATALKYPTISSIVARNEPPSFVTGEETVLIPPRAHRTHHATIPGLGDTTQIQPPCRVKKVHRKTWGGKGNSRGTIPVPRRQSLSAIQNNQQTPAGRSRNGRHIDLTKSSPPISNIITLPTRSLPSNQGTIMISSGLPPGIKHSKRHIDLDHPPSTDPGHISSTHCDPAKQSSNHGGLKWTPTTQQKHRSTYRPCDKFRTRSNSHRKTSPASPRHDT